MTMHTVWITDDDPFYHDDMKCYLEASDFEVFAFYAATDLLIAFEEALKTELRLPNVIVVDMMMPYDNSAEQQRMPPNLSKPETVTGVRLTRELLKLGWKIENTVAITAFENPVLKANLKTLGFTDGQILFKPSPAVDILTALLRASAKR